ncbi:uncharacterized protein LOC114304867 [Camellia sinensis]|uniref:uncharacterized protein LOC114304867 n=1 Tax=Camellia sinensis TaxID=4442 RepID=UPI001035E9F5|nr:uncharacterized protein LOC114304867 [Camellia sinensis]
MNNDDDDSTRMDEMLEGVAALARQWHEQMNLNYVEAYRIATDYYKAYVLKVPCRTSILSGRAWITELHEGHSGRFRYELCMPKQVFLRLCTTLVNDFGLRVPERPHGLEVEESVAIFIHVLKNLPNRELQERFQHSGETISRHFHTVLKAMKKFTVVHCRPPANFQTHRDPILQSQRQYLPFKDCLGALDGTHVPACIKESEAAPYFSRKGCHTQNILAVCDFNMCFVFVSCGWEGSMHDSRVLSNVTEDPQYNFPTATDGRYYLVDSGYSNNKGFLAPYKGNRYHQPEFQGTIHGTVMNCSTALTHLRSVIERTFGAWKMRWRFLKDMPRFDFRKVQVPLVAASMALHNLYAEIVWTIRLLLLLAMRRVRYPDMRDRNDLAALTMR